MKPKLWMTDQRGVVFSLDLLSLEWTRIETKVSRCSFKKLAALEHCIWALGANQNIYICVFRTDLPIRVQVSRYENQRWSPRHGFSIKGRISTDRPGWSDITGRIPLPDEHFVLDESRWKWESDWFLDESNSCDIEGWQYALDFPATYYDHCGKLSFVRRRRWARYKQFIGFDQWFQITALEEETDPVQDITVGSQAIAQQHDSNIAVWALTFSGKLLYRKNICQIFPDGDEWLEVQFPPETCSVVQISASPSGPLWAVTWDGFAIVRVGISHLNPTGTSWHVVHPPGGSPGGLRLTQVTVGQRAVWALCSNGKVYFRKGIASLEHSANNRDTLLGSGWVEMVGDFRFLTVSPSNQVFGLAEEGDEIIFRSGITGDDLVGKTWTPLTPASYSCALDAIGNEGSSSAATGESHVSGASYPPFQTPAEWGCISAAACSVDSVFLASISSNDKSTHATTGHITLERFRDLILERLQERNARESSHIIGESNNTAVEASKSWIKRGQCRLQFRGVGCRWCECHLKLRMCTTDDKDSSLLLYYCDKGGDYIEVTERLREMICISRVHVNGGRCTLALHTIERSHRRDPMLLDFAIEKDAIDWLNALTEERAKLTIGKAAIEPCEDALWATTTLGGVFFCNLVSDPSAGGASLHAMSWHQVGGHMERVTAGEGGVVWALGCDGQAYTYDKPQHTTGSRSPLQEQCLYDLTDFVDVYIYENQRWNPWQGFSKSRLPSDRWEWSDESGVINCDRSTYRLPSSHCRWETEWHVDYATHYGVDSDGWQFAVDFPRVYRGQRGVRDYVRRRRWKRRYRVETRGPWKALRSDVLLQSIAIEQNQSRDRGEVESSPSIAVWAVGTNGDVLFRSGVTSECPQGESWMHVPAKESFSSVSIASGKVVWGVAADGATYLRAGFGDDPILGTHWFHVGKQDVGLRNISVGGGLVLAIDDRGTLWRRDNVSAVFPEGTEWIKVMEGVQKTSVGVLGEVWIVRGNDIEQCIGSHAADPIANGLTCILSGFWSSVCNRGCLPTAASLPEECATEETEEISECDVVSAKQDIDPYAVDIYKMYGEERHDDESMGNNSDTPSDRNESTDEIEASC